MKSNGLHLLQPQTIEMKKPHIHRRVPPLHPRCTSAQSRLMTIPITKRRQHQSLRAFSATHQPKPDRLKVTSSPSPQPKPLPNLPTSLIHTPPSSKFPPTSPRLSHKIKNNHHPQKTTMTRNLSRMAVPASFHPQVPSLQVPYGTTKAACYLPQLILKTASAAAWISTWQEAMAAWTLSI